MAKKDENSNPQLSAETQQNDKTKQQEVLPPNPNDSVSQFGPQPPVEPEKETPAPTAEEQTPNPESSVRKDNPNVIEVAPPQRTGQQRVL